MNKFDQLTNQFTYAEREAHEDWLHLILANTQIEGKRVADIGCGGGIYTRVLAQQQPASLFGIDGSKRMLEAARSKSSDSSVQFIHQDCEQLSEIPDNSLDVILERALIHHLKQLQLNFSEVSRVLAERESVFIVQDRTPDDCLLAGSPTHIRGYFFECFPFLAKTEKDRRYSDEAVRDALAEAGFTRVNMQPFWETRATYTSVQELKEDLQSRRGRTILHELTDSQLEELIDYIEERIPQQEKIIEKDRWSVWFAYKE
ncbi:class I SAM-dependent methyltransferase [Alkalicoccobacillus porphyridii]|uniref:Class I SAM-dependent methyltransferase n=1 Tax=Alkalicoccobacillus porphyridii TaxID=2597270 RepID=A0A554A1S8_9BACI|nr:class I SAM-dependent methyltransferase [Alkalicoccobacillus porphyridii]TSB47642.1 class I SAM-dependent methyltransferase [Alkalicoccobacillus porphyridii]